jgi:hypothetical protein
MCCGLQSRAVSVLTVPKVVLLGPRLNVSNWVSSSTLHRLVPRNWKVLYSFPSIVLATGFNPVTDALETWEHLQIVVSDT